MYIQYCIQYVMKYYIQYHILYHIRYSMHFHHLGRPANQLERFSYHGLCYDLHTSASYHFFFAQHKDLCCSTCCKDMCQTTSQTQFILVYGQSYAQAVSPTPHMSPVYYKRMERPIQATDSTIFMGLADEMCLLCGKEGTFRAVGMAGIEPTLPKSEA